MENRETELLELLLTMAELRTKRFIEAENELLELSSMRNFKRFFARKRINDFITSRLTNYNF